MSSWQKRSLSESSTGSEDLGEDYASSFKRPRLNSFAPSSKERRESQASTASSTSFSVSCESEDVGDHLNNALESNSETEDELPQRATFSNPAAFPSSTPASANNAGPIYSSMAQKLMAKMGYSAGQGLGKTSQGRVEPVLAATQRGRRGLGLILKGLEDEKVDWDPSQEVVEVNAKPEWLPPCAEPCPTTQDLISWMSEGPRKESIADEDQFCDQQIIKSIMKSKEVFDQLEGHEMRKARTKSNPFEIIQGVFFLNRAAMKMAEMDAMFDYIFTSPKDKDGKCLLGEDSLLYFADVCAGPGGFSEYVLWRKRWRSKGFGFTLKGKSDFKLEDFYAGTPESFETHYGEGGRDGDGDVFKESNIKAFAKFVLEGTDGKGVHFMMADGGFSVEGQENIQEILSKQLYLCQFLVAMSIVRTGGHFVCKLFDLFTPFSIGLVYLMYRAFDEVCIHKPNTSRPANSERYIICKGKRPNVEAIRDYMFKINSRLNQLGFSQLGVTKSNVDVNEIVPLSLIFEDKEFAEYMRQSNDVIGERQIVSLIKIRAFHQDQNLFETRQRQIRDQCLKIWNVPDQVRKAPGFEDPQHRVQDMLRPEPEVQILESAGTSLDPINLNTAVKSVFDWKCILMGSVRSEDCTFYLGMGRNKNYSYNKIQHRWQAVPHSFRFDLPAQTLIYAESVQENRGEGKGMRKCPALHIIDAVYIAGEDWRVKYDLKERNRLLRLFVKAMAKPSQPDHVIMRVKDIVGLENLQDQCLALLKLRTLKGFNGLRLTVDLETEIVNGREFTRYMMPTGILMLPIVNEPYMMAFSRSQGRKYWFNYTNRESVFECPPLAMVDFKTSFQKRLLWNWDEGVQLYPNQEVSRSDKKLHWDILNDFCRQKMGK